jgi:glycosyltransferase involved in cell wall biosynthesis
MTSDMAKALCDLGHGIEIVFMERSRRVSFSLTHTSCEGFPATALMSFRPAFIGFHTWNWGKIWRQYLSGFDAAVVVCGSPYIAFPFLRSSTPLYVWSAVTLKEDLKGRIEKFGVIKKLAYRVVLPSLYRQEREVVLGCRHLWALSQSTMRDFVAMSGRERMHVSVLSAAIDTDLFRPLDNPPSGHTILFTGRYNDGRKDVGTLIKAFLIVHRQIAESRLVLIGEGPPLNQITYLVSSLGLSDAVEFLPEVGRRDLVRHYQAARVFAIPSKQEGLCISGLEAMACGLPVVSTACGGPETYIQNGQNGFLVPVNDHIAMGKMLLQLLSDEIARRAQSSAARKFVLEHCGVNSFKTKIAKVAE